MRRMTYQAACCAMALGCAAQSDHAQKPPEHGEVQEIIDNLTQAGFPADDIQVVDHVVYVGRDAEVSLAASREMLQPSASSEEQYRTTNTISASLAKICINGSTFTGAFSTALDLAIQNYNEQPLSFAMARTPSSDCGFTINAVIIPGAAGGSSGFPSGGLPFPTINIHNGLSTFSVDTIEHVITHEIGHTIGFRHSDFFNRSISCGAGGNEGDAGIGAILVPGTPSGATVGGSIMNACFRNVESGEFTASDVTALTALYPEPATGTFLTGDVNGDGRADLIQPKDDGTGRLEIQVSLATGSGYAPLSTSRGLGQGATALAFLTGDVNGDGRTDLIQPFDNAGRLGIIVYASNGTGYAVLSATANMGQGSVALAFLTGDVNGDGRTDLIQPFDNGGRLGLLVYASNGTGYALLSATANTGEGSTALAFLTGDVNGDGRTDLIQPFNNAGRLGLLVYRSNGVGYSLLSGTPNLGQGAAALAFLTGDVNGDGRTDLIQPFDNAGRLGLIVYASNGTSYSPVFTTLNIGQGSTALAWLTGDVNGDGRTDLIQPFDNAGRLGLIAYASTGTGYAVLSATPNTGQGSAAMAFLAVDSNGDGRTDVLQPWANGARLGLLAYTSNGVGFVNSFGSTDLGPR